MVWLAERQRSVMVYMDMTMESELGNKNFDDYSLTKMKMSPGVKGIVCVRQW